MREQEIARQKEKARKKRKNVIIASILVVVSVLSIIHVIEFNYVSHVNDGDKTTTSVNTIPWGKVFLASKSLKSTSVNIYYVSWLGCPIGAVDSWAFYLSLSTKLNISHEISFHSSDTNDVFPNTPGLIFGNVTGNGISLHSTYVYGNATNLTVYGDQYQGTAIEYANRVLQNELPTPIYNLEINLTEKVPVQGRGVPSAYLSAYPHLNTNVILTTKNGTFMLNGPLYSPSPLQHLIA